MRFGENNLHNCEIMLKDISESKRINNQCSKELTNETDFNVDATMVSYLFWPTLRDEKFLLPAFVETKLKEYAKKYASLKPNRMLDWKSSLGTVEIEIEFEEKTMQFSCNPLQATIISYFEMNGNQ